MDVYNGWPDALFDIFLNSFFGQIFVVEDHLGYSFIWFPEDESGMMGPLGDAVVHQSAEVILAVIFPTELLKEQVWLVGPVGREEHDRRFAIRWKICIKMRRERGNAGLGVCHS